MIRSPARDFLQLYRVRDWLHFLPLPLAGWFSSDARTVSALVGGVVAWALALAFMSAINQAFDDRLDRATVGKNPVGARFSRRQAVLFAVPPALAVLPVLALFSPHGIVPGLVALIAATVYSAPPRLKRVPVLGTLWNIAVGAPALFFAGAPDFDRVPFRLLVALFAALLLVSQLIHEAEDRDDDRSGGVPTVAVLTGTRGALAMAVALLAATPVLTWLLSRGLNGRGAVTVATAVFSVAWIVSLVGRMQRADLSGLRRVRLNFRYAAFVLGAAVFTAAALN